MLPKENRLTKQKDFERLFDKKNSAPYFNCQSLLIKALPNNEQYSRFGFIVSLKVSKKAVDRNRIKRQLREIFHQQLTEIKPGNDIAVLAKPLMLQMEFADMEKQIDLGLKKLKLK